METNLFDRCQCHLNAIVLFHGIFLELFNLLQVCVRSSLKKIKCQLRKKKFFDISFWFSLTGAWEIVPFTGKNGTKIFFSFLSEILKWIILHAHDVYPPLMNRDMVNMMNCDQPSYDICIRKRSKIHKFNKNATNLYINAIINTRC